MPSLQACKSCGALLLDCTGPVHPYMESSPACWAAFGRVLAREYSEPSLRSVHRLSVDSYAVQHPGGDSRQAIQSVGVHLSRLCLFIERGLTEADANDAMLRIGRAKSRMTFLKRPGALGEVTVADVAAASSRLAHRTLVHKWSSAAWHAWQEHHATVRRWVDLAEGS